MGDNTRNDFLKILYTKFLKPKTLLELFKFKDENYGKDNFKARMNSLIIILTAQHEN